MMEARIPCMDCWTLGTERPWMRHDNNPDRCRTCGAHPYQHADTTPQRVQDHYSAYGVAPSVGSMVCAGIAPATAAIIMQDICGNMLSVSSSNNQNRHARLAAGSVMTLYHQTDHGCAAAICASQTFRPGSCGLAGAGMYFAVSVADTNHKAQKHGVVLCATARLGSMNSPD